jgi:hypothetical protein
LQNPQSQNPNLLTICANHSWSDVLVARNIHGSNCYIVANVKGRN